MVYDGPIMDNHFHLNRQGLFLDAARDFQRVGGTDLVLVHCPDFSAPPETLEGHRAAYADTLGMAQSVREKVGLGVRVCLGPILLRLLISLNAGFRKRARMEKSGRWRIIAIPYKLLLISFTKDKPTPLVRLGVRTGPFRMKFGTFPTTFWTRRCTWRRRKVYRSNFMLKEKARRPIPI